MMDRVTLESMQSRGSLFARRAGTASSLWDLPTAWTDDADRCMVAGVAEAAHKSQTRPEIALAEIDSVIAAGRVFWMRAMPDTVSARRYVEAAFEN